VISRVTWSCQDLSGWSLVEPRDAGNLHVQSGMRYCTVANGIVVVFRQGRVSKSMGDSLKCTRRS
jgi:hypothetical protein